MAKVKQEDLKVGDQVYFYDNPSNPKDPTMGWILERPGTQTISILTFSPTAGFVERKSVRHKDDPFWAESETAQAWHRWGCYEAHPLTELMPLLAEMIKDYKIAKARRDK